MEKIRSNQLLPIVQENNFVNIELPISLSPFGAKNGLQFPACREIIRYLTFQEVQSVRELHLQYGTKIVVISSRLFDHARSFDLSKRKEFFDVVAKGMLDADSVILRRKIS